MTTGIGETSAVSINTGTFEEGFLRGNTIDAVIEPPLRFASLLSVPFWRWGVEKLQLHFQEFSSFPISSSASIIFRLALTLIGLPFELLNRGALVVTSFARSRNYIFFQGRGAKKETEETIGHWNICTLYAMIGKIEGLSTNMERLPSILQKIKDQKQDILFLCEVNPSIDFSIVRALQDYYRFFFTNIGLFPMGFSSGLWVASKVPPIFPPRFIPFTKQGEGGQAFIKRGFFVIETKKQIYFYAHLQPGNKPSDSAIRMLQVHQLLKESTKSSKPALILGDLNFDPSIEKETYALFAKKGFIDRTGSKFTCVDSFLPDSSKQNPQKIDYIFARNATCNTVQVDAIAEKLSDHHMLSAQLA